MIYEMKLLKNEFDNIKYNGKIIEVRINDAKRRDIHKGDIIRFNKISDKEEAICVSVEETFLFPSFQKVYESFPISYFGYNNLDIKDLLDRIYTIYTREEEQDLGVTAIRFKVLKE